MALKPSMDIKPGRHVRVGTKMTKSGLDGEIKLPTVPQYAEELEQFSQQARQVAAGELAPADAEASAPVPGGQTETRPAKTTRKTQGE